LLPTDVCGLLESSLSSDIKVRAGQNDSSKHRTPNVLYTMLPPGVFCFQSFLLPFATVSSFPVRVGAGTLFDKFGCALAL